MSAVPRSQRNRNKPSTADPPDPDQDNVNNDASSPAPQGTETKQDHTAQPSLTNAEAMNILMQLSGGPDLKRPAEGPPANGATIASSKSGLSAHSRPEIARATSDRSSSLSELDDLEDREEAAEELNDAMSSEEEDDTEAETERLHISPEKPRMLNVAGGRSGLSRQLSRQSDALSDIDDVDSADEAGLSVQPLGADTTKGKNITSAEAASRKRKRTSSLVEPARKRLGSGRLETTENGDDDEVMPDLTHDDELSDPAEDGEIADTHGDEEEAVKSPTLAASKGGGEDLESSDRELSEPPEEAKTPLEAEADEEGNQDGADAGVDAEADAEGEAEAGPDAEDDEAEAAAKSEDELARKITAMEELKPIENLFAIFRDKLYDERLAELSAQLELLNQVDCQHPEYLAMRQAVDLRRDEKIELEQVSLRYKVQVQERRIVADRAQIHSQYHQTVREMREEHMAALNKRFTKVQQDRRKFNAPQTTYGYRFDPNRVEQIAQQRSYNKEVSLLSGMAKYVGFPSGPSLPVPKSQQIDEDLRKMKIRPQAPSYVPALANTRVDENVNDESWLERNAWANPNHPASQQVRYNGAFSTPASQRRTVEVQYGPIGSGSTIPFASDPPSSAMATRVNVGDGSGRMEQSSPFEQLKRRNLDAQQKNDLLSREAAASVNGGLGISTPDERAKNFGPGRDQQERSGAQHQFPTPGLNSGEAFNRERHEYARSPLPRANQLMNGSASSPAPPAERIGVR